MILRKLILRIKFPRARFFDIVVKKRRVALETKIRIGEWGGGGGFTADPHNSIF